MARSALSTIRAAPGTYALILSSSRESVIRIGRLHWMRLNCGYYVCVDSSNLWGAMPPEMAVYRTVHYNAKPNEPSRHQQWCAGND